MVSCAGMYEKQSINLCLTTGSFPQVKRPGNDVDHPPLSNAKIKERVEVYLYSPSESS